MNMGSYSCCTSNTLAGGQVDSLAALLKIVAEPSRLKLLCILKKGEHCVCELIEHTNLSQSLISHHLKDLKKIGVVSDEKRGLKVFYKLTDKGKKTTDKLFSLTKGKI